MTLEPDSRETMAGARPSMAARTMAVSDQPAVIRHHHGGGSYGGGITFRENAALKKRALHTISDGESIIRFKLMKGTLYLYEVRALMPGELEGK